MNECIDKSDVLFELTDVKKHFPIKQGVFARTTGYVKAVDGISYEMTIIGRMYRGFTVSPVGSIYALLWGFFDGFLLGLLIALIYNKLILRFKPKE